MANSTSTDNQDIDLGQLSKKVKNYFSSLNDAIFDGILFIKRNIIVLVILIVIGSALGYYKDKTSTIFEQKIFVIPNFGSIDYLYEEIENMSSKIRREDPEFMKVSGFKNADKFLKIDIKPVVEIYDFIEDKDVDEDDRKFQLFRLISENGDMKKILEDKTTARHYKNHIITITTSGETEKSEMVDPILKYFNSNSYFLKMKEEYVNNLNLKIIANDTVIKQIDAVLNGFSNKGKNGNLMYYNDNTELSEVIKYKNKLTKEQGQNRIDKVNYSDVVKDGGTLLNIYGKTFTSGRMKFIVPLLFVLAFIGGVQFRNFYRKQSNKRKSVIV